MSLFLLALYLDRALRFTILYPIIVSLVGVLNPLYIIVKSKKMSQKLADNFKSFLRCIVLWRFKYKSNQIHTIIWFKEASCKRRIFNPKFRRAFILKQSVGPDLAKFCHFGKSLQVFGKILTVYVLFGKMLSLLWQICDIFRLIFVVANGQNIKK